jgi:hypothetical protein
VAVRFKVFSAILMAVLALGLGNPLTVGATGMSEAGKICCCTGNPICSCPPGQPCKPSCTLAQVQTSDKQIPARTALASLRGHVLLFSLAPAKIKDLFVFTVVHRRDLNASPPYGGAPPQAMLRLWLI